MYVTPFAAFFLSFFFPTFQSSLLTYRPVFLLSFLTSDYPSRVFLPTGTLSSVRDFDVPPSGPRHMTICLRSISLRPWPSSNRV
ncbi:hypothetical protein FPV67DRAFT_1505935 [Lyophyllum atratum]|nr:hypothetical protein FPV67DRAFT_1505935 [Lyophyllum atratum]